MHGDEDTDTQAFDAAHLDIAFECPRPVDEMLFPDIYVGLDIDLLAPGDGIVTDRHRASANRHEADNSENHIAESTFITTDSVSQLWESTTVA